MGDVLVGLSEVVRLCSGNRSYLRLCPGILVGPRRAVQMSSGVARKRGLDSSQPYCVDLRGCFSCISPCFVWMVEGLLAWLSLVAIPVHSLPGGDEIVWQIGLSRTPSDACTPV